MFRSIKLDKFLNNGVLMSPILLHLRLRTLSARIAISESVGTAVNLLLEIESSSILDSRPRKASGCSARILLLSKTSFFIRRFLKAFLPICNAAVNIDYQIISRSINAHTYVGFFSCMLLSLYLLCYHFHDVVISAV